MRAVAGAGENAELTAWGGRSCREAHFRLISVA